jgi:hypothetical protein
MWRKSASIFNMSAKWRIGNWRKENNGGCGNGVAIVMARKSSSEWRHRHRIVWRKRSIIELKAAYANVELALAAAISGGVWLAVAYRLVMAAEMA